MKQHFPFFEKNNLLYFDHAATSLKPKQVIHRITDYYSYESVNGNRSSYPLANKISAEIEETRQDLKNYLNLSSDFEVIFTKGATESLNFIADTFFQQGSKKLLTSYEEHHSNYLPFKRKAHEITYLPLKDHLLDLSFFPHSSFDLASFTWISNTLGKINPIKELGLLCKKNKIPLLLDASQVLSHLKPNLSEYHFDFLVFSTHKIYGPTGLGVLIARKTFLQDLEPYQVGGGMVKKVEKNLYLYEDLPYKFEAGTLPIASILGFKESLSFLKSLNLEQELKKEKELVSELISFFQKENLGKALTIPDIGLVSFQLPYPSLDFSFFLGQKGVCVRSGKLCTEPLLQDLNILELVRFSFGCYTQEEDLEKLKNILKEGRKFFENLTNT